MSNTPKEKVKILNDLIVQYSKIYNYVGVAKVYYLGLRFAIVQKVNRYKQPHITRIPIEDIDEVLKRVRAKMHKYKEGDKINVNQLVNSIIDES